MKTSLNLSCRFDRVLYNQDTALLINYKAGFREPVRVKLNSQMKTEALLVALALNRAGIHPKRFFVQLVTLMFGVFEAEFSASELAGIWEETTGTLATLESHTAALQPSPDACDKCPAILICGAAKSLTVLRALPISSDPKQLAADLDKIAVMREYMDEYEEFCKQGLLADPPRFEIPNWAMVPGAERRDFKDLKAARTALLESGIPSTDLDAVKSQTVAAFEKIYARHYGKKPEEVREAFHRLLDGCIEVKQNKSSLKRIKGESRITTLTTEPGGV